MDSPAIIYDVVIDCLNLFENLTGQTYDDVDLVVVKDWDASTDPGESEDETIRALQKHFSLWMLYVGAVADPSVSLDTRLRDDWKTKAMVVGLLHSIEKSLRQRK